ncbi:uncharacterized protein METZ01_LOCUS316348, partial [marine metagenome]
MSFYLSAFNLYGLALTSGLCYKETL